MNLATEGTEFPEKAGKRNLPRKGARGAKTCVSETGLARLMRQNRGVLAGMLSPIL